MSQFSRPSGDQVVEYWSPSTGSYLYTCLDEAAPSDTDYISRTGQSGTGYGEINLSSVSDPNVHTGHVVRYRITRNPTNRTITCVVRLICGSTEIASWIHTDGPDSYTTYEQTLTTTQAGNISSYSDLRLRFDITALQNAQAGYYVSWAEMEVPDAGAATYTEGAFLDALLKKTGMLKTASFDAIIEKTGLLELIDLDGVLSKTYVEETGLDALAQKSGIVRSAELNALLQETRLYAWISLDSCLMAVRTALAELDAVLVTEGLSIKADVDALLRGGFHSSVLLDAALMEAGVSAAAELDAVLAKVNDLSAKADALLQATGTVTANLDSLLRGTRMGSTSFDAVLSGAAGLLARLDALLANRDVLKHVNFDASLVSAGLSVAIQVDALVKACISKAVSVDALVQGPSASGAFVDAVLSVFSSVAVGIDAVLFGITRSVVSCDAVLQGSGLPLAAMLDARLQSFWSSWLGMDGELVPLVYEEVDKALAMIGDGGVRRISSEEWGAKTLYSGEGPKRMSGSVTCRA